MGAMNRLLANNISGLPGGGGVRHALPPHGRHLPHAAGPEAAWKYFILGSVGIALAFFGTILVYLAAQGVLGEGLAAMSPSPG